MDPHQDILQSISSVGAYNDIKYRLVTESRNRVNLNAFGLFLSCMHRLYNYVISIVEHCVGGLVDWSLVIS